MGSTTLLGKIFFLKISKCCALKMYRKNSKYWDMYVWANSVDSDQTALKEQSDQDLHCLPFFLHLLEALLHCCCCIVVLRPR